MLLFRLFLGWKKQHVGVSLSLSLPLGSSTSNVFTDTALRSASYWFKSHNDLIFLTPQSIFPLQNLACVTFTISASMLSPSLTCSKHRNSRQNPSLGFCFKPHQDLYLHAIGMLPVQVLPLSPTFGTSLLFRWLLFAMPEVYLEDKGKKKACFLMADDRSTQY